MTDLLDGETRVTETPPSGPRDSLRPVDAPGPAPAPTAPTGPLADPLWKQVWRAITPLGRTVLAAGVAALLVGRLLGWEELGMIAVICLAGVAVGVVFLLAGQADLLVDLNLGARRVVAGDPANTKVRVANRSSRRTLPLRLETRMGKGTARLDVPGLGSGAAHDELVIVPTSRRSVVPVGPVRSVLGDPLGLVRREILWTGTEELYVHPRTVRLDSMRAGWQRDLEGEATNERSPSDVAFHTLREYVPGDDRRHIHWKTTARQVDGTLMVKEFVDTRRSQIAVAVPMARAHWTDPDDLELALSVAGSLGIRAIDDGLDLACLAGPRVVPARHRTSLLDGLSRLELGESDDGLLQVVRRHRDHFAHASIVVLLAGSAMDVATARRAADEIGAHATKLVLRCDTGVRSGRRSAAGAVLFDLGALDDLPRVLGSTR